MKLKFDKKLLKISAYVIFTAISIYISFEIISNLGSIFNWIFSTFSMIYTLIKPLIIAAIIAYIFYPLTRFIENILKNNKIYSVKNLSNRRIISIFSSYLFIIGIIIAVIWGIYFMIGGQLSQNISLGNIIEYIENYANNSTFDLTSVTESLENNLNLPFIHSLEPYIIEFVTYIQNYIIENLGSLSSHIMSIGSSIATFFIAFIISIYLLKDSEYFLNLFKKLYYIVFRNSKAGYYTTNLFLIIHDSFSRFIRGQLLEACFVGLLSTIALTIVGIHYAPVIGLISGICNMIPYVGPVAGTILAALMALLSGNFIKIIYAVIAMIIVQQIDNHLLAPKIVGDSVGLHAVFTMLAIIVGGNVGGLFGMLLAVPLTATFRVIFNLWYDKNFANSHAKIIDIQEKDHQS